jgi:hypothetical protein
MQFDQGWEVAMILLNVFALDSAASSSEEQYNAPLLDTS